MSAIDYIVPPRSASNIAAEIELLRPGIRTEFGFQVDVVGFLEKLKHTGIDRREFNIVFFNAPENAKLSELAYVRIDGNKINLYCDEALWWDAKTGDPMARFILAHEAGHLILHTNKLAERHFSPIKIGDTDVEDERRSEWQANKFAELFLVPSAKRLTAMTVIQIAVKYGVLEEIAELARTRSILKFPADCEGETEDLGLD